MFAGINPSGIPFIILSGALGFIKNEHRYPYPHTRTDNVSEILHGVEIIDPYRWLEDQQNPATRQWIDEQNSFSLPFLESIPGKEERTRRLEELIRTDTILLPTERNGRYFFRRRTKDQEQCLIYMREGLHGSDRVLVDPHPLCPDHMTSVEILDISGDGTLLAYGIRIGGEDEVTVRLLDVDTMEHLTDTLPRGRYYGFSITPDKKGFYYSKNGPQGGVTLFHRIGTTTEEDTHIFDAGFAPEKIVYGNLSDDGRYLIIHVMHGAGAKKIEIHYKDLTTDSPARPIVDDIDARFEGEIAGDTLFMKTNWEAPKGRILAVDLRNPARDAWKEIIPEAPEAIEHFTVAGRRLFVNYLKNVASLIKVYKSDGSYVTDVQLPAIGTATEIFGRWETHEGFFLFNSFHIPSTIYRYDTDTNALETWSKLDIPLDSDLFEINQEWYASADGTRIPMFVVHKKGLPLSGDNPTILTGYGGFGLSRTPAFSALYTVFIENGGVIVIPSLRGGGEFGEEWHEAGMLHRKQNVFDDFIGAARWLIDKKYTNPSRLAISGRSNGGLLVGAALTQRPDLFGAVVCGYPLLDMIRYHKFLVARYWVPEYGCAEHPEQFRYIHAYSPYHQVRKGEKYPAVLFITGDSDTRVDPLHARKLAALLQSATGSDKPVFLLYDTRDGHMGGKSVKKQVEDLNYELSFLFWQLGVVNRK